MGAASGATETGARCAAATCPVKEVGRVASDSTPSPKGPRRAPAARQAREPELFSCRDFAPHVDGVAADAKEHSAVRTERKSKTLARSAMVARAAGRAEAGARPHASLHAARKAQRMPPLPRLRYDRDGGAQTGADLPAIQTAHTTPRHAEARRGAREFGLTDAPVFYPSWDEFQDPLAYIQWTARPDGGNGAAYGIVKIVPPEGWQMDFVVDEDRLNELSAEGRVAQNYQEQLERFHAQQGHGLVNVPRVAHRPLNLYALKLAVHAAGGYEAVCAKRQWADICRGLGYTSAETVASSGASVVKGVYARLVAPFEAFLRRVKGGDEEGGDWAARDRGGLDGDCGGRFHTCCVDPPLREVPDEWVCTRCLVGTGGDFGFDDGETHSLYSFWSRCSQFERAWAERSAERACSDADAAAWRRRARGTAGAREADEDCVEAEFWRLVHSVTELVDVEYGADVHSSTHGNASPTMEAQPHNAYARSGWNLNNLPILAGSLLRYIKSDISGMTVPWIYIGMMFSAFCWHNEDHYTYSINYQHWGHTKTWYGVPGADAERFETAMQRIAPELFEACPDLLLQLVTMMSPALVRREGVRVYAVNQRPNEFVVTFPKAYHSGFNHGFNLNEAVNFALPDWVMDGLACARRYQTFARQPVFSHDELLVTVAVHNQHVHTAVWMQHAYRDMVDRELRARAAARAALRAAQPDQPDLVDARDRPEHEYQCAQCRAFCYLSHVVADGAVACHAHAAAVHGADWAARAALRVRFTDAHLDAAAAKLAERAAVPAAWQQRVRRLLVQHPRPPLRTLYALAQEGERIPYPLPELAQLHTFLDRAAPWVEQALAFLTRRQGKRAPRTLGDSTHVRTARRARDRHEPRDETPAAVDQAVPAHAADRSPAALLRLCECAAELPFEAPELQGLPAVVEQMHAFQHHARAFLASDAESRDTHRDVDAAERLLEQGAMLRVELPDVDALRRWIAHAKWFAEVGDVADASLSHGEVSELLSEAAACGIPPGHALVHALHERRARGDAWGARASALLDGAPLVTRAALDALLDTPADTACASDLRARVGALQQKAAHWHDLATEIYEATHLRPSPAVLGPHGVPRAPDDVVPHLHEARRVLDDTTAANVQIPFADELRAAVALHDQWNAELAHILRHTPFRARPGTDVAAAAMRFCERTIRVAAAGVAWGEGGKGERAWGGSAGHSAGEKAQLVCGQGSSDAERATCGGAEATGQSAASAQEAHRDRAVGSTLRDHAVERALSNDGAPAPAPPAGSDTHSPANGPHTPTHAPAPPQRDMDALLRQAARSSDPAVPATDVQTPATGRADASAAHATDTGDAVPHAAPTCAPSDMRAQERGAAASPGPAPRSTPPPSAAPSARSPARSGPCICFETLPGRSVTCDTCGTLYHFTCIELRVKKVPKQWTCAFCNDAALPALLATRQAVSQLPLVALLQNPAFRRDRFRFLPSAYARLQTAIRATVEFGVAVSMQFRTGALPAALLHGSGLAPGAQRPALLCDMTRCAVGCPVDVLLIADAAPQSHVPSVLDVLLPAFHIRPSAPAASAVPVVPAAPADGTGAAPARTRRRAKRARLIFREEAPPSDGAQCSCREPDTGTMVQCDRCTRWFHNVCMWIEDPDALQEKWFCPVCCVHSRRRYQQAEVRVRDVMRPQRADAPDLFVDVHASVLSDTEPVLKVRRWAGLRRIVLHLVAFEPAVLLTDAEPPSKRARTGDGASPSGDVHGEGGACAVGAPGERDDPAHRLPDLGAAAAAPGSGAPIAAPRPPVGAPGYEPGELRALPGTLRADALRNMPLDAPWHDGAQPPVPQPPAPQPPAPPLGGPGFPPPLQGAGAPASPARTYPSPPATNSATVSPADDRHRAGRANLRRRGVSEAMMQTYAMGWNGDAIVCQLSAGRQVVLGAHIHLAPDDPDGTRLIIAAVEQAPWNARPRLPPLRADRDGSVPHPLLPLGALHPPRPTAAPPRLPGEPPAGPLPPLGLPPRAPPVGAGPAAPRLPPLPPLGRSTPAAAGAPSAAFASPAPLRAPRMLPESPVHLPT
ncbi:hypothetical protein MSPP1_002465 [Malassezia sp. CBS 17886]|nr:hypothetical protein MSPP1_002465 [Malassezia sp. CBS 17886]